MYMRIQKIITESGTTRKLCSTGLSFKLKLSEDNGKFYLDKKIAFYLPPSRFQSAGDDTTCLTIGYFESWEGWEGAFKKMPFKKSMWTARIYLAHV